MSMSDTKTTRTSRRDRRRDLILVLLTIAAVLAARWGLEAAAGLL
jgi:preprotein translocase subunit SecE